MTAPASPRVAEGLVKACARELYLREMFGEPDTDSYAIAVQERLYERQAPGLHEEYERLVPAIITLAQDAKLREVAEWCEERRDLLLGGEYDTKDDPLTSERALQLVASHLRAMMVKP